MVLGQERSVFKRYGRYRIEKRNTLYPPPQGGGIRWGKI